MLRVLAKVIPLPLASVSNLRSLIYIGNIVDLLLLLRTVNSIDHINNILIMFNFLQKTYIL